jgi:hypothetical protein
MSKSRIELIVVPVVLFFGALCFIAVRTNANHSEWLALYSAMNNLRRINTALKDDATRVFRKMPDAKDWADQIVASQPCVLKEDFVTPDAYPAYGVFFNASFEGCDVSEIGANSVILFACREGQWNASGTKETFLRLSSRGRSYIVTWNSDVYEYDRVTKTARRLSDNTTIAVDELVWSKGERGQTRGQGGSNTEG